MRHSVRSTLCPKHNCKGGLRKRRGGSHCWARRGRGRAEGAPRQPGRVGPPSYYTPTQVGESHPLGTLPLGGDMKMGSLLLLGDLHTVGVQKGVQRVPSGEQGWGKKARGPPGPPTPASRASHRIFRSGNAPEFGQSLLRAKGQEFPKAVFWNSSPPGMPRADQSFLEEPWEPP